MLRYRNLFLLFAFVLLSACGNKYYYVKGLHHAQNPMPASVYTGLTTITDANHDLVWNTINGERYVLAVTWKADTTFFTKNHDATTGLYKYNTGSRQIFATAAPYLKERKLGKLSYKKLDTRLDQLLGLPPTAHYSYFLEVWVKPEDMIRPCFDPSLNVNVCEFVPSTKDNERVDYQSWLYKYIYDSYSDPNMMNRYPFSHLGYTYDWNPHNKSHVGLSEFVIGVNKTVYIKKIYTTRAYFE